MSRDLFSWNPRKSGKTWNKSQIGNKQELELSNVWKVHSLASKVVLSQLGHILTNQADAGIK